MATADTTADVCARLDTGLTTLFLDALRYVVLLLESTVTVLHLDVVGSVRMVNVRVWHGTAQTIQFDLLGEPSCATHDRCEEARVSDLPKLESEVNRGVTGQVITLGVEAEAGYVLSMTF